MRIQQALTEILGEGSKTALLHMVSKGSDVPLDDLVSKPMELMALLHKSLGDSGHSIVEKAVIREIRQKFGLDEHVVTLGGAIEQAKANFIARYPND